MRHTDQRQTAIAVRPFTIRWILGLAAISIATLALVSHASARTQARAKTIQVTAKEFSLKLSATSLARPGTVTFSVRNVGHMEHNFRINGKQTRLIAPGKTSRLVVTFKKKASYHYLCTVPGHAAAGMKGVFSVR
jgi:plastocyanin